MQIPFDGQAERATYGFQLQKPEVFELGEIAVNVTEELYFIGFLVL